MGYEMINRMNAQGRQFLVAMSLSLGLLLGACSWVPTGASHLDVGIEDRGVASWYGEAFHGKQAANGELFDMGALTAAHRTLPLGSVVRVVNLANGKHVYVRITDRGPYVNGRILDLSRGAAAQIGMLSGGSPWFVFSWWASIGRLHCFRQSRWRRYRFQSFLGSSSLRQARRNLVPARGDGRLRYWPIPFGCCLAMSGFRGGGGN